jgi:hypothetical protein
MSMVSNAIAGALKAAAGIAGGSISYARTGSTTATIQAAYGRREYDFVDGNAITRFVSHDFIFPASLLNLGSGVVLPRKNDTITATIGENSKTFQVLEVAGHCFQLDPHGVLLRVHTKEVG